MPGLREDNKISPPRGFVREAERKTSLRLSLGDAAHNDPDIASPKKEEKREVVGEELFPGQIGGEEEGLAMTLHWIVCWLWRRRRMGFGNGGGGGGESFGAETEVPDSFQKSILAADAVPSPPFSLHLWLILFRFGFFYPTGNSGTEEEEEAPPW